MANSTVHSERVMDHLDNPDRPQAWRAGKHGGLRHGPSIRERLHAGLAARECESDCMEVTSQPSQTYPSLSVLGTCISRHRIAFYLAHGHLPEVVMHTCDNPKCINWRHLTAGTYEANTADMMSKGRERVRPKQDECRRGHSLNDPDNLYWSKGARQCRECSLDRNRR